MTVRIATLVGLLLSATACGFASPAQAYDQAAAESPSEEAVELARIVMPLDAYVDREARMLEQFFLSLPASDAEAKAFEEEYPGAYKDIWSSMEDAFRVIAAKEHPDLVSRLAAMYQQHLTRDEMAALRTFYLTETGKRALGAGYRADPSAVLKEIIADPDRDVSADAVAAVQRDAIANAVAAMTPADAEDAQRLAKAVPFSKMLTVQRATQALTLEWLNEPDPEMEAELEKLITGAIERYLEGKLSDEP